MNARIINANNASNIPWTRAPWSAGMSKRACDTAQIAPTRMRDFGFTAKNVYNLYIVKSV